LILPDNNIWISLVSSAHYFHRATPAWIAPVPQEERLVFFRVTQLSVLRLLTTRDVMGEDVMTQREALRAYEDLLIDPRIDLIGEPEGVLAIFSRI
jgi:hypothetical protein